MVGGSDTTTFTTGEYWSGAESFTLVPEPGTSLLLALGALGVVLPKRRRR